MMKYTRVCFSLLLSWVLPAHAQQSSDKKRDLEQEVIAEEKEVWELNVREDWDTYAKLLSDDVLIVYSTGYSDKTDVLRALLGMSEQHYLMEDIRVIPVGDAAGLVIYKVTQDWKERGKKMTAQYYVSSLWQKQNGKWLNRFWQETDTAEPDDLRAAEQKYAESHIVALEKRLWNGNPADVANLEAADYEALKHAHRYHRADDEAAAKDAKFGLVSMDDVQVRMLHPDVALVTYHATERGTFRGIEVPPSLYFASLWVKRDGEWKNVFLAENLPDAFTDAYKPAIHSDPHAAASSMATAPKNSEWGATDDTAAIEALEEHYNYGVNSKDVNLIMSCYARDKGLFVFDDGPPREHPSWESYKKDWEEFFSAYPGPVTNVVSEESITVVGTVAYGHNIQTQTLTRKDGSKLNAVVRVTDVYRKMNGNWLIVQEHVSFPVDAETGKADLMSRP